MCERPKGKLEDRVKYHVCYSGVSKTMHDIHQEVVLCLNSSCCTEKKINISNMDIKYESLNISEFWKFLSNLNIVNFPTGSKTKTILPSTDGTISEHRASKQSPSIHVLEHCKVSCWCQACRHSSVS